MAEKTIYVDLDHIDDAIREVQRYRTWVEQKSAMLTERLSLIGAKEASVRFTAAIYDGVNDSQLNVEPIKNGYRISASGTAVAFIEFGAGVYHNPSEPYPIARPAGVVGIGEYGQGKGKRQAWGFKDAQGALVVTHGTPAALPMWYATEEIRNTIVDLAREVFAT